MPVEEITPKDDVMFKIIFSDTKHPRVLIHFLNSVIKPESPIKSVEIAKSELTPEYVMQKGVRLDIVAKTEDQEIINVEMQRKDEKDMTARALFYWSELFFGQLEVGNEYNKLKRTISISILDFNLFRNDERYWRKGYLKDDLTNEKFTNLLEMHFLELKKMKEMKKDSPITFWIEFFKNPYSENIAKLCEYVPEIKEAKKIFERAKSDPEARELMRVREKAVRDYANDISVAKSEGLKEGRTEGLKEGLAEGELKGELRGRQETACNLLSMGGLTVEQIAKATGLSVEEVEKLKHGES